MNTNLALVLLAMSLPIVSAQGKMYEVRGCNRATSTCRENECQCTRWMIHWHTPGGTVWGVTTGKTRESVERQRDRDIAFEKSYAVFFKVPFDQNFANPSEPICDACVPQEPMNPTDAARAAIHTAGLLYLEWTRKVEAALPAFMKAIFLPNTTVANNPFQAMGSVLQDYANALHDVNRKLKHMRGALLLNERELGRLSGILEGPIREIQSSSSALDSAYSRLPESIRNALEGKTQPASDGGGKRSAATWELEGVIRRMPTFANIPDFDQSISDIRSAAAKGADVNTVMDYGRRTPLAYALEQARDDAATAYRLMGSDPDYAQSKKVEADGWQRVADVLRELGAR